jgi:hypothetical protein
LTLSDWKDCLKQIATIRAMRLLEINDELESEESLIKKDSELQLILSRIQNLRERIQDENKKDELAARRYRANPLPNQKPFRPKASNYQVGIYRTQMAKCICKLFFVQMRMEIRRKRIRENLLTKMQDEIYEHVARSCLWIMSYKASRNRSEQSREDLIKDRVNSSIVSDVYF